MKDFIPILALVGSAYAFPAAVMDRMAQIAARDANVTPRMLKARQASAGESSCGPIACTTFNEEEQFVSTTGQYAFVAPDFANGDVRGPCPGLNAAANHGYLPHDGVPSIAQTIDGLGAAYGMGADLAAFLAAYAIALDGDVGALTWSIGGPYKGSALANLGGTPGGISYSHNNYESDASVTRSDAYLNNGDAYSLVLDKFEHLYSLGDNGFTMDSLRNQNLYNRQLSESTNPYFFSAPFSGLLVAPAAHNFIINFMSNHTASQPSGYLDQPQLKTFFSITGEPGSFVHTPGYEAIPDNWYRRPSDNPYTIPAAVSDVVIGIEMYPSTLQIGGNTNGVNSFAGVDLGNLTGGVYNSENLLDGNNLGCFLFQSLQIGFPDALKNPLNDIASALSLLNTYLEPVLGDLSCPALNRYDVGLFSQFPGYSYQPTSSS